MPALSEYSNVYDSAVSILRKKGYQVWYDRDADLFCAEKDGWDFQSDSPCGLLGLVAIYEFHEPTEYSDGWWKDTDGIGYRELPPYPEPFRAVWDPSP